VSQSLSAVYLHAVFSTKDRQRFFQDRDFRTKLHAYLCGISQKLDCPMIVAGGVEDHVHVLARHSRLISQADWVKELKRASSLWLKKQGPGFRDFGWQAGYGIFSVSTSNLEAVGKYIADQEAHHKKKSFQDEFRGMLEKHRIEWDERYVWD
jgi:putative transposase